MSTSSHPRTAGERDASGKRTVCIIGGGATGLTLAHALERNGHEAIVLEMSAEVGGKCVSVEIDGHPYDLGGHFCSVEYEHLARLLVEFDIATVDATPFQTYDPVLRRPVPRELTVFQQNDVRRYAALRRSSFPRIGEPGMAHSATALAQPVHHWLFEHRLNATVGTIGVGYTGAGYGYLEGDLPALYFAKYVETMGFTSLESGLLGHPGSFTVAGGFQMLWRKVAAHLRDVRKQIRVVSIRRNGEGVVVETTSGTIAADDLILTIPLDQALPLLDATPEERDIARRIRHFDYRTVVCTITGLPRSALVFLEEHSKPSSRGHCTSFHHRHDDTDIYTCYSYGSGNRAVAATLAEDVAALGGRLEAVHLEQRWAYMPHFGSADVADGVFSRLEAMQGRNHTYHAGSLLAFELVECNMAYAKNLVGRFFPRPVSVSQGNDVRPRDAATVDQAAPAGPGDDADTAEALCAWLVHQIANELLLPDAAVDPHAPLETFQIQSLTVVALAGELSSRLNRPVAPTVFLEHPTLDAVARHLARAAHDATDAGSKRTVQKPSLILPLEAPVLPLEAPRPFFCLGGAYGSSYYLRDFARAIRYPHGLCGVQMPGLDGVEEPIAQTEAIAARCLEDIRRFQPHGPYRLGGHSFGGLVAYEIGRLLHSQGEKVARIVLMDSFLPLPGQAAPAVDEVVAIGDLVSMHNHMYADSAPDIAIAPEMTLSEQRERLGRALGAPATLPFELYLANILAVYQASLEAITRHQPVSSDLPVTLVKAAGGFPAGLRRLDQVRLHVDAPRNGWENLDLPHLQVASVPGNHFNMLTPPHLSALAASVQGCLAGTAV